MYSYLGVGTAFKGFFMGGGSEIEEVGVGSGAGEVQFVAGDAIEEEPIGFDMKVAVALPIAAQGVVAVGWGEGGAGDQKEKDGAELGHVLSAALGKFDVALEPAGADRGKHVRCRGPS